MGLKDSQCRSLIAAVIALTAITHVTQTAAQASFPERAITIIVPFPPGGGTDLIARVLGKGISEEAGVSVVILNRAGAGTIIGSEAVARAEPNGYTLLVATFAHSVNPSLHKSLPYDTKTAFAPITLIASSHNILVVKAGSPLKSVRDILAHARANPDKLNYASQGVGTSAHLAGELFKNIGKVEITHVPYRGAASALADVVAGHIEMMFATSAAVSSFIEAGTLHAVGITAPAGQSQLAGVPALADEGLPGYALDSWYGLYAPAGTPPAVIARLNGLVKSATGKPEFAKLTKTEGLVLRAGSPAELEEFVANDTARWSRIVRENKIPTL